MMGRPSWRLFGLAQIGDVIKFDNQLGSHTVDVSSDYAYEKAVRDILTCDKRAGYAACPADQCYARDLSHARGGSLFDGREHVFEDHCNVLQCSARMLMAVAPIVLVAEVSAVMVQLNGWLRQQNWRQLRRGDGASDSSGRMALSLGDRSKGDKVMTGSGRGVELLMYRSKAIMGVLIKGLDGDDPVSLITADTYLKHGNVSQERLGLQRFGPPQGLRHGGAARPRSMDRSFTDQTAGV